MTHFIFRTLFVAGFLFPHLSTKAQSNCDDLKKENEYLKKALNINTPTKKINASKIDFNLLRVEGNIKEQTVDIILTLVNQDANREFQFNKAVAIDMEGNEYETFDINIGSASSRNKIFTDTPVKTVIHFKKILPGVKILKLVPVTYFYGDPGRTVDIQFKDLSIEWK